LTESQRAQQRNSTGRSFAKSHSTPSRETPQGGRSQYHIAHPAEKLYRAAIRRITQRTQQRNSTGRPLAVSHSTPSRETPQGGHTQKHLAQGIIKGLKAAQRLVVCDWNEESCTRTTGTSQGKYRQYQARVSEATPHRCCSADRHQQLQSMTATRVPKPAER